MEERMWIAEEEVSGARLEEICRMAGYTTSVDQDGDLVVHGDVLKTLVVVNREKSVIHFADSLCSAPLSSGPSPAHRPPRGCRPSSLGF